MEKNAKKTQTSSTPAASASPKESNTTTSSGATRTATNTKPAPEPTYLTLATIELVRGAKTLEESFRVLISTGRAKVDTTYTLNTTCPEPLPQRRGACLKVVAVAARINGPFKVADIVAQLPDVKGAKYWVGRLAKTGHFTVAE